MAKEQRLESAATRYARQHGIISKKFVSPANPGVPDRIFIFPTGIILFVEFKAPGEKPTAIQRRTIETMKANRALVLVIDDIETFKANVDLLRTRRMIIAK